MGPGHFSHHGSLLIKADDLARYLSNCTEEVAHSVAMCQGVAMFIARQQGTSHTTVVFVHYATSHGWLLTQDIRAMTAWVRKMGGDIHPMEPDNSEAKASYPVS